MDPRKEIEDLEVLADNVDTDDDSDSVEDFIRQLEEKEKDLHITIDTTIIEIEQGFDDGNPSVFVHDEIKTENAPESMADPGDLPFVSGPNESVDAPGVSHALYNLEEEVDDLEEQIAALKQTIARMENERAEQFQTSQRRAKDFEAFKLRTEREKSETKNSQAGDLAARLLPAIDNLGRALNFAEHYAGERSAEFKQFYEGIVMVNRQVADIFASMGIEPIQAVGEAFDPHIHEAVAAEETDEFEPNTICEEMLRGYRIGDRVIRHSMVKVAAATSAAVDSAATEMDNASLSETPDHNENDDNFDDVETSSTGDHAASDEPREE